MSDIDKIKLSALLYQIESIKDNSRSFLPAEDQPVDEDRSIWQDDVDACDALLMIIKKLVESRCQTVSDALNHISEGDA